MDGLRELVSGWKDTEKAKRFKDADEFYKAGYGSEIDIINTESRGIDFDYNVEKITIKAVEDNYLYRYVIFDKQSGQFILEPQGNYFIKDPETPINTLGFNIGNRVLVKYKVTKKVDCLKSKGSTIEWSQGGNVYAGSSDQYFIPNSKNQGIEYVGPYNK
jgi:hypothetical protein